MKNTYVQPKLTVLLLGNEDVMATSSNYFEDSIDDLNIVNINDVMNMG